MVWAVWQPRLWSTVYAKEDKKPDPSVRPAFKLRGRFQNLGSHVLVVGGGGLTPPVLVLLGFKLLMTG